MSTIIHWSIRSMKQRKQFLIHLISRYKPLVICLSQIGAGENTIYHIGNNNLHRPEFVQTT